MFWKAGGVLSGLKGSTFCVGVLLEFWFDKQHVFILPLLATIL